MEKTQEQLAEEFQAKIDNGIKIEPMETQDEICEYSKYTVQTF